MNSDGVRATHRHHSHSGHENGRGEAQAHDRQDNRVYDSYSRDSSDEKAPLLGARQTRNKDRDRAAAVARTAAWMGASVAGAVVLLLALFWFAAPAFASVVGRESAGAGGSSDETVHSASGGAPTVDMAVPDPDYSVFELRHVFHHNTEQNPEVHARMDVDAGVWPAGLGERLPVLKSRPHVIRRLKDRDCDTVERYLHAARDIARADRVSGGRGVAHPDSLRHTDKWRDEAVPVPDVEDRETVLTLALMASNAYVETPHHGDWLNLTTGWNHTRDNSFGWMEDGVRGHVFADSTNSTIVVAIKGTSAAVFDDGGPTAPNDKINDNLLFSCCCARVSYLWNTVCDCYTGESYTCDETCLEESLYSRDRYYRAALDVYRNVTALYPHSNVWVAGHSLGGSLAALLGRTYGLPVVAFEAPGELLAAKRLHLPHAPGVPVWRDHIWHFGHTADPVYMGVCNGAGSSCWIAGYAMETQCHSGLECVYDVVTDLGWHVSLVNHRIHVVIDDVIQQYNDTPKCQVPPPCKDCYNWKFIVPEDESPTSSVVPSSTREPTPSAPTSTGKPQKCLRRAWWGGCVEWGDDDDDDGDKSTTASTAASTTTTTTIPTSSSTPPPTSTQPPRKCIHRGWFGECDEYEDDPHTTTPAPSSPIPTTTDDPHKCLRYGWFGNCVEWDDDDPKTSSVSTTPAPTSTDEPHKCLRYGWFGNCVEWDDDPKSSTSPPSTSTSVPGKCVRRTWYGKCVEWQHN